MPLGPASALAIDRAQGVLVAAEAIGIGLAAIDRAARYARERIVFDRPIGQNQGVQFPIAKAYVNVEAANLMRFDACRRFDAMAPCGPQANMAKLLAARVAWAAADNGVQIHGGNGFALEYPISRVLCDARILSIFEGAAEIQAQVIARRLLG